MKKHIDVYLIGQIAGESIAKDAKEDSINIDAVIKAIKKNKAVFMLGLIDSLGWEALKSYKEKE